MRFGGKAAEYVKRVERNSKKSTTEILDSDTFREVANNAVLVALDLEGPHINVNEIGLAVLNLATIEQLIPFDGVNLDGFQFDNAVKAHSIQISEIARYIYPAKYGSHVVISKVDITKTVYDILTPLKQSDNILVLMGYSMSTEFNWMGAHCPSFLSFFDYWADMQEIVCPSPDYHPGLRNLVAEMAGSAPIPIGSKHRAVMDAVVTLAIASRVLTCASITIPKIKPPKVEKLSRSTKKWRNRRFRAKITAANGEVLPACISCPQDLEEKFGHYDLKAVFLDERKLSDGRAHEWWLCFDTRAGLDTLYSDLDGSVFDNQTLQVEKFVAPRVEFEEQVSKGVRKRNSAQDNAWYDGVCEHIVLTTLSMRSEFM